MSRREVAAIVAAHIATTEAGLLSLAAERFAGLSLCNALIARLWRMPDIDAHVTRLGCTYPGYKAASVKQRGRD